MGLCFVLSVIEEVDSLRREEGVDNPCVSEIGDQRRVETGVEREVVLRVEDS